MKTMADMGVAFALALLAAGCGSGAAFRSPFGETARVAAVQPPVQQTQAVPSGAGRPTVAIAAPPSRVQDTIIARARSRGTTIVGSNSTGVTLEAQLASSTEVVERQCGPHRPGRAQRIYLETLPDGTGTIVSEDRFIVDDGASVCQLALTPADVENGSRALGDLKRQAEGQRVSTRTGGAARPGGDSGGGRAADPAGGLEPVNPGRPVVPIR